MSDRTWTRFKTNQPSFDEVARARAILERAGEIPRQQRPTRGIPRVPVDRFFSGWVHVVAVGVLFLCAGRFVAVAVSKMEMGPGALISLVGAVVISSLFYLIRRKVRAMPQRISEQPARSKRRRILHEED